MRSSGLLFSFPFAKLPARISCIDVYFRGTGRERKKIIREERDDTKGEGRKETTKLQIYTERARCIIRAESLAKFELCRTKGIVGEKERERDSDWIRMHLGISVWALVYPRRNVPTTCTEIVE